jgi:hypothetical protein
MLFKTAGERDIVFEKYGAIEGLKQNMDKLAEYLKKMKRQVVNDTIEILILQEILCPTIR